MPSKRERDAVCADATDHGDAHGKTSKGWLLTHNSILRRLHSKMPCSIAAIRKSGIAALSDYGSFEHGGSQASAKGHG